MGNAESSGNNSSAGKDSAVANIIDIERVKRLSGPAAVASRYHLQEEHPLARDYEVQSEILGRGLRGDVVVARNKSDGRRYALKTLSKVGRKKAELIQLAAEVEIHLSVDHPSITRVQDIYESPTSIFMVSECCEGGELCKSLQEEGIYSDAAAAEGTHQMLRVIQYLHAHRIAHRDVKMENFLFQDKDHKAQMSNYLNQTDSQSLCEAPQLRLIDFGFATVWDESGVMKMPCGSTEYASPELVSGTGYTCKSDLWSIGVIVWMLLAGYPPFYGHGDKLLRRIKSARPDMKHPSRWKRVSEDAKDFVQQLLVKDPEKRLDAAAALQHTWLNASRSKCNVKCFLPSGLDALHSMQRYAAGCRLQRAALQMLVRQLSADETRELRKSFASIDQGSKGWISLQDFSDAIRELWPKGPLVTNQSHSQVNLDLPADLFPALDSTGKQRLYYTDFLAAVAPVYGNIYKDALQMTFARLDADGSGTIGLRDIHETFGMKFESVAAGVAAADVFYEARRRVGRCSFEDEVRFDDLVEIIYSKKSSDFAGSPRKDLSRNGPPGCRWSQGWNGDALAE